VLQHLGRQAERIEVAARLAAQARAVGRVAARVGVVVRELFPDAHRLEVHAEERRHRADGTPGVVPAVDLVHTACTFFASFSAVHTTLTVASKPTGLVISGVNRSSTPLPEGPFTRS